MRQLLEQALPRGYVAAYRWLGDREESRDACQEAATRALAASEGYDRSRPFYPWFYRILRNHCFDRLRRRPRDPARPGLGVDDRPAGADGAEARLLQRERSDALARAIGQLAQEHREVIELRHFQDLSYEEMAQILGVPTGTVMSRLYRARRRLRLALLDQDPALLGRQGEESS